MERLTFEGDFCDIAQCREYSCLYNDACSARKVWERLKAYEDTGLEPEEVFLKDKADVAPVHLGCYINVDMMDREDAKNELARQAGMCVEQYIRDNDALIERDGTIGWKVTIYKGG